MSAPVTVAVVSWNTRDLLARCLKSLVADAESGLADVHVVDNGSSDGSPALVRERFAFANLIEPGANLGFGRAVNLVAEMTDSPWLCAANADVALAAGALGRLVEAGERHPHAGALAPMLTWEDGTPQHSFHGFPTLRHSLALNLGLPRVSRAAAQRMCIEGRIDPAHPREVPWAIGALLLLRRSAFDAAGGFDERRWMYAEDLALGWELARHGWTTRYVPDARAVHASGAAATQAFGERREARYMEATYAWMRSTRGTRRTQAVAAVNWAGAAARAAALAPLARRFERFRAPREEYRVWADAHRRGLSGRGSMLARR
ncbi:MAG TPA: glycosyltransferase family 2 protein [Thermoleophilaceae bacterium]|nr:glycosyltransferase family 2 protein [Thermoleophilaceae bacterium]